jgi:hypothetical protein
MTLFDPNEYNAKGKVPCEDRQPRKKAPKPATVNVHTSDSWRVVSSLHPGLVHKAKARTTHGGWSTWCGIVAGKRSFANGLHVEGCALCFHAHAMQLMTRAKGKR